MSDPSDHLTDEEFEALVELKARAAFQEMDIIAQGEAMLAARWDQPFGSPQDHYELANHDITRERTAEEKALEAGAITDGEARSRARDEWLMRPDDEDD